MRRKPVHDYIPALVVLAAALVPILMFVFVHYGWFLFRAIAR